MASWRSQRNNNETFPRKTNGPTQLLQKFTTAQHHFFREIISTSLNETKAWFFWKKKHEKKKNFFERKLYNVCLPTLFSILKSRKTQIIAKNTCEFLVWYPSVSKLFVHVFFCKKKTFNVSFSTKTFRISLFFRQISRVIVVAIMICPVGNFSWDP